ncbi:four helix bundle protein [Patiriisocius marinistellae]|uniref:Four helix bundle protein n=1 Tax=Patiriisocius marinistellae TaxID=2494560 RepID=A0A5J4FWM7_9FLAO|nr:four helix bundle protein [Patiriisocius marinistellae]GEQ85604.1 four helix bundle protein [Patiriisocius marinistellae]
MGTIKKFEDLEIWQRGRKICQIVEFLFQNTELGKNYRLRNQMEGSSGSIMDNIAEGFGRDGNKEFHNFLSYAKGSVTELKSQLYRCYDKNYISEEKQKELLELCDIEINKIGAFMFYLRKTEFKGQKFK